MTVCSNPSIAVGSSNVGPRVVIQGVRGAFHELAAQAFFGHTCAVVPALSFPQLFELAADPAHADAAVMAIENSIAGSILENYNLLKNSDLEIVGEVYLRICQQLLALPGTTLNALQEVHSHPMALAQCAAFFDRQPHIRLVATADTAESAAQLAGSGCRTRGVIASTLAAERYGLATLAAGIETVMENYTRFLVLQRHGAPNATPPAADKFSACFTLPHRPAALATALAALAAVGANLTKIQSVPLLGRPWEYHFFMDCCVLPRCLSAAIEALEAHTIGLKVLGRYVAAAMPE